MVHVRVVVVVFWWRCMRNCPGLVDFTRVFFFCRVYRLLLIWTRAQNQKARTHFPYNVHRIHNELMNKIDKVASNKQKSPIGMPTVWTIVCNAMKTQIANLHRYRARALAQLYGATGRPQSILYHFCIFNVCTVSRLAMRFGAVLVRDVFFFLSLKYNKNNWTNRYATTFGCKCPWLFSNAEKKKNGNKKTPKQVKKVSKGARHLLCCYNERR